jgi:hypothetical protein
MGLRSQFNTSTAPGNADTNAGPSDDDAWHSSDRGELTVVFVEAESPPSLGQLAVTSPLGETSRLGFQSDGTLLDGAASALLGRWQLWPDGSLELVTLAAGLERRERIWFTKPNLRLRSCVEHGADGATTQASFCSEIRRVSRP